MRKQNNTKTKHEHRVRAAVCALILIPVLVCGSGMSSYAGMQTTQTQRVSLVGRYDSADLASVRGVDTTQHTIRFKNHATGMTYTLNYDNTSYIFDAFGNPMSASLLEEGEVVEISFLKSSKHLNSLNVRKDVWEIRDCTDYELVRGDETAKINGEIYHLDKGALIMADGSPTLAEDILSTDTITVYGMDKEIYSIIVTKGHGYISLSSDMVGETSLSGYWLELGNTVIHKIEPNMFLSVPEGDYDLSIIGDRVNHTAQITIKRNQETVIDTSSITVEKPKECMITVDVVPEDAQVMVDGEKILTFTPQAVEYGYHTLKISAEGYETQERTLKVGTPNAKLSIELVEESDSSKSTSTKSSSSASAATASSFVADASTERTRPPVSNFTAPTESSSGASTKASSISNSAQSSSSKENQTISGYKIYFEAPYKAELYMDGSYIGVIPCSTVKTTGSHTITLKRDDHETKSYTISIDSEKTDDSYEFPELVSYTEEEDVSVQTDTYTDTSDTSDTSNTSSTTSTTNTTDTSSTTNTSSTTSTANTSTTSNSNLDVITTLISVADATGESSQ